jgi:hypothetical protein
VSPVSFVLLSSFRVFVSYCLSLSYDPLSDLDAVFLKKVQISYAILAYSAQLRLPQAPALSQLLIPKRGIGGPVATQPFRQRRSSRDLHVRSDGVRTKSANDLPLRGGVLGTVP